MRNKVIRGIKQIFITQLLSILFAVFAEIHQRLWIANGRGFTAGIIACLGIIILILLYTFLIWFFLEGKWVNVVLISISFFIYNVFIIIISAEIFPMNIDPNDYGIMGLFISICQWIGVLIASILGTYFKNIKGNT